ncbi:hypothetical protein FLGE108171_02870 [Flavobacterium gelidilacus]|jgi:uncharacterized protein YxjI|uniref:hypothetical protein n=1 Tax=Flavobacterium gelidilacus TaxID=206041 RepID=UPI00047E5B07|nr:hypothetical protein [Flavobacterium gelidilacus]
MKIEIENNSVIKISSNKNNYNYNTIEIEKIYVNFKKKWLFSLKKYYLVVILKNGKKEKINLEKKYKESIKKFVMDYNYNLRKNRHTLI